MLISFARSLINIVFAHLWHNSSGYFYLHGDTDFNFSFVHHVVKETYTVEDADNDILEDKYVSCSQLRHAYLTSPTTDVYVNIVRLDYFPIGNVRGFDHKCFIGSNR